SSTTPMKTKLSSPVGAATRQPQPLWGCLRSSLGCLCPGLLRTALRLGYKLVPYEYEQPCAPKPDNPIACDDERERGQAQNLVDRILRHDPQAKILGHVGRGHNSKEKSEQFAFMAWYFKEISKIDPFAIDQVDMSE